MIYKLSSITQKNKKKNTFQAATSQLKKFKDFSRTPPKI